MNLLKRTEFWLVAPGQPKRYITAPDKTAAQTKAAALAGKLGLADWSLGHDPDATYHGRFQQGGRRIWRDLKTTRAGEALQRLRALVKSAREGRWAELHETKDRQAAQKCATLGEILAAWQTHARVSAATARHYRLALAGVVRRGLAQPDLSEVDLLALPASVLTGQLLLTMQTACLKVAGTDELARDRASITANSLRRGVRSLFSKRSMAFYADLSLPDLSSFLAAPPLREPAPIFHAPEADVVQRLRAAAAGLRETDPNCYRIWLLSYTCGLRKKEILHARWNWVETRPGVGRASPRAGEEDPLEIVHTVHIQTTEDFRPKGRRDRVVPLEPFVLSELLALRITSLDGTPGHLLDGTPWDRRKSFVRFGAWMKGQGWTRRKKAHEFRKLYGHEVNVRFGLVAAQQLLGHADIATTRNYYTGDVPLPQLSILGGVS